MKTGLLAWNIFPMRGSMENVELCFKMKKNLLSRNCWNSFLKCWPTISTCSRMVSIDDRLNAIIRELIGNGITLAQAVEAFEGKYIVAAMTASKGNVTQASRKLGVHRNTLHNKLRSQTMLNGFADSTRPVRRRLSANRVTAPKSSNGKTRSR